MVRFAYLAGGKLLLKDSPAEAPRLVDSQFGEAVRDRAVRIQRRTAWKTQGRGARFMSGGLLWGMEEREATTTRVVITGIGRGRRPGELIYALETADVGGVFVLRGGGAEEQRLFHSAERRVQNVAARPDQDLLACAVTQQGGAAAIAVMRADGTEMTDVTEGDSVDLAPQWIPGAPRQLVYQSAGIGRDEEGAYLGLGPFTIQRLDVERGEASTLVEEPGHDCLAPRPAADGGLLYIRRPWRRPKGGSPVRAILDFLLFPLRLLFALLQWLNFFTARYGGRPLTTAGGPKKQGADVRQMMVWGNLIDAEKATRARRAGEEAPALVPSSWQLVRRPPDGATPEVLARQVLAFDLLDDGTVLYTNGSAVYLLPAGGGQPERLCIDERIAQVVALDSATSLPLAAA